MLRLLSLAVVASMALLIASFAPQKPAPKTVQIGNRIWLAENMSTAYAGSWAYANDNVYSKKYGRLYNWELAQLACKNLGEGWRLPDNNDWDDLINALGGNKLAALKLKPDGDAGFNTVYAGMKMEGTNEFKNLNTETAFWSASTANAKQAYIKELKNYSPLVIESFASIERGLSCRCVKDLPKGE